MEPVEVTDEQEKEIYDRFAISNGELVYKKKVRGVSIGDVVGTEDSRGYKRVDVLCRKFLVHRIVFFMVNGWWPACVDHIDGNKRNNHPTNLRAASKSQNCANKSGGNGKGYRKIKSGKYEVYGSKRGFVYVGVAETEDEAIQMRRNYMKETYGEFYSA